MASIMKTGAVTSCLLLLWSASVSSGVPTAPTQTQKFDCTPDLAQPSQATCTQRGCTFHASPAPGEPHCEMTLIYRQTALEQTSTGSKQFLTESRDPPFGGKFSDPYVEVENINDNVVRIKFADRASQRYEVPKTLNFPDRTVLKSRYRVQTASFNPFSIRITRKETGTIIFDTGVGGLVLSDQFLQISTLLPSNRVYGLGENKHRTFRHDLGSNRTWPVFNRDQPPSFGLNSYGTQPFYICSEDTQGHAHGVFILNSNAQEYSFTSRPSLTYRTVGGILDMYVFLGNSMEEVVQLYNKAIGLPVMPPYWGLGFHLSRYGFRSTFEVKEQVKRMEDNRIPFDAQYIDIDHLESEAIFTVDSKRFPGLNDYFHELRNNGLSIVYLLDPCLMINKTNYQPYLDFKRLGANIKWPSDVTPPANSSDDDGSMLGWVWPDGKVIFPDFMQKKAGELWRDNIIRHRNTLIFDGLWIDMNDPSNFGTNEERAFNWPVDDKPYWTLKCPVSKYDDPPYRPMAARIYDSADRQARLSDKTVCMIGVQGEQNQYQHYDVHNLYGWAQTPYTLEAVKQSTGTRGFVLTRSNFPGSGSYAGTWTGDNNSSWEDLRQSIITMLEYNLFGMPIIGADICGFFGATTHELCLRWHQLGAFYPYSRNHNSIGSPSQDPGSFDIDFARATREILEIRYWLLPFMYTHFHRVNSQGGSVVRALAHEFPASAQTYDIDHQFLWGSDLLVSPILHQGQTNLTYYLPPGDWYDFYTYKRQSGDASVSVPVTYYSKPALSVRAGRVTPMQKPANTTRFSRKQPFKLLVTLDAGGNADGSLFWDDGLTDNTYEKREYYEATYSVRNEALTMRPGRVGDKESFNLYYNSIDIVGVAFTPGPALVTVGGARVKDFVQDFNPETKVLTIRYAKLPLVKEVIISWSALSEAEMSRVDCWPERLGGHDLPTMYSCRARNCVWDEHVSHPDVPVCYFPHNNTGYTMSSLDPDGPNAYKAVLRRKGKGPFGKDFPLAEFRVEEYGENVLRVMIDTVSHNRFRPPVPLNLPQNKATDQQKYKLVVDNKDPLAFSVYRLDNGVQGEKIWSTSADSLVFADQFLQLTAAIPSYVYGLGENTKNTFKRDTHYKTYPIFARDQGTTASVTLKNFLSHYGTHPFYTSIADDGQMNGVLFFNSGPQDYTLSPGPRITYRSIGGALDFYFFMGPKPEQVIRQYHEVIGRPIMPPYWGLGFALSKYGYNSLDNMKAAVDRTREAKIPVDILYGDIDHFDERRDFTIDPVNFKGLPEYFEKIRNDGMKTVIILDPAIVSNYTSYAPYDRLSAVDGNVHWPDDLAGIPADSKDSKNAILGWVWPTGKTVYPDFFKNATVEVWADLIAEYRKTLKFDALWIDMNEPTAFGTNEDRPFNWPEDVRPYWSLKCPVSKYDDPPYRTGGSFFYDTDTRHGRLSDKTICLSAVQGENKEIRNYDVHNMYGHSQIMATKVGLERALGNDRGFIVSRSTFVGSGTAGTHWLGDNFSGWDDLRVSIVGMLDFNMFGFPFTGADICGHFGNSTAELCKRWTQLGAFYGFCRNHNAVGNRDQDPASFNEEVTKVARAALSTRYWLLPYLYTLFHQAHTQGGTVSRPLHHEFIEDVTTRTISRQFMWGSSLLISPILEEGATSVDIYLPPARWYDFYSGALVSEAGGHWSSEAVQPDSFIPLRVRGGSVLTLQRPALNTTYSRLNRISLIVALNNSDVQGGEAQGTLFWDDGTSRDTYARGLYLSVDYSSSGKSVRGTVAHNGIASETGNLMYENVEVSGVEGVYGTPTVSVEGGPTTAVKFIYNNQTRVLFLMPDRLSVSQNFVISWT